MALTKASREDHSTWSHMSTTPKPKTPGRQAAAKASASTAKPKTSAPRAKKMARPRAGVNASDMRTVVGRDGVARDLTDPKYVDIKGSKTVQAAFLAAYAACGSVAEACTELKVYRLHVHQLREEDPDFAAGYAEAFKAVVKSWEEEVARRAFKGIPKGIYHQGELVDTETQYSDRLAEFMLKAHGAAERYNPPTRASIDANTTGTFTGVIAYREMSDEDLNKAILKNSMALGILKMSQVEYAAVMGKDKEGD